MNSTIYNGRTQRARKSMLKLIGFILIVIISVTSVFMLRASAMQSDNPKQEATNIEERTNLSVAVSKLSVEPGDTLWSIAKQYGDGNTKQYITKIMAVNQLSSGSLDVGQVLILP